MKAADVERRELLEGRRGKVDAAGCAARAGVRDGDRHGPAIGASDDHLPATHRVTV